MQIKDYPELKKAFDENRRYCPKDKTALRWKKGVGAWVCADGHILDIDIKASELLGEKLVSEETK